MMWGNAKLNAWINARRIFLAYLPLVEYNKKVYVN